MKARLSERSSHAPITSICDRVRLKGGPQRKKSVARDNLAEEETADAGFVAEGSALVAK